MPRKLPAGSSCNVNKKYRAAPHGRCKLSLWNKLVKRTMAAHPRLSLVQASQRASELYAGKRVYDV